MAQIRGGVKYIGISNFSLEECKLAKSILEKAGIPLYGVQNHYSIISRKWEEEGLLDRCKENNGFVMVELLVVNEKYQGKGYMRPLMEKAPWRNRVWLTDL